MVWILEYLNYDTNMRLTPLANAPVKSAFPLTCFTNGHTQNIYAPYEILSHISEIISDHSKIISRLSKIISDLSKIISHHSKILSHLSEILSHLSKILSHVWSVLFSV